MQKLKQPFDFPPERKPFAWGAWMILLIIAAWLLVAWLANTIMEHFGISMS